MESRGSSIRSAARATFSERPSALGSELARGYRSLPIRWRLAGGSAVLTFAILLCFALVVGTLTTRRIRADFNEQTALAANQLADRLDYGPLRSGDLGCRDPNLDDFAGLETAVVRVVRDNGEVICKTKNAPNLGVPATRTAEVEGYRIEQRYKSLLALGPPVIIQFARPLSGVRQTIGKVRVFLSVGVLAGTLLALLAGLLVARRAMSPIAELTSAAREIERTRDPSRQIPHPPGANDEIAELALTLDGMLHALDDARGRTEASLERQRRFVADASHELRTPLTSVLANLEILSERLGGEDRETAEAALRSSRRMRRLVADLLLLARADAARRRPRSLVDLAGVVVEAAAELEPVAGEHPITVDAEPGVVLGARDELHRMVLNLMENAIRHTPAGTPVRASVGTDDGAVRLVVEDDGPGIPAELEARVFERFVRGGGDAGGGGSGLGLAIVRSVAESHRGTVRLERPAGGDGARFVVTFPAAGPAMPSGAPRGSAAQVTTGPRPA